MSVQATKLTNKRRRLVEELSKYADEIMKLNMQIAEQQATCMNLTDENDMLKEKFR